MEAPDTDDWLELSVGMLPVQDALAWVNRDSCGASVIFCGSVRDHSEGRPGVSALTYEAYESQVVPRLRAVAQSARSRWPELGRIALWHRTGTLGVGDVSVVVAVSAPHRAAAFDAARFAIDTVKTTVPIWKQETWTHGIGWGTDASPVVGAPVLSTVADQAGS